MNHLATARLTLEPLRAEHAPAMFAWLSDPALYEHLDETRPESLEQVRERYRRLETRTSPDGSQHWLNWAVMLPAGDAIGYVQATVSAPGTSWIAYVFSRRHWGFGYATEATACVMRELAETYRVQRFLASVEEANRKSVLLLERLGFHCERHDAGELLFVRDCAA